MRLEAKTLQAIERLGGEERRAKLLRTLEDCKQRIEPWMPIFFWPVGKATFTEASICGPQT